MRSLNRTKAKLPGTIISVCFGLAVLPLANFMMPWVWVLFFCALTVVFAKYRQKIKPVSTKTVNLLAVFCSVLLIAFAGSYGLLSTMINLLIVAGCLKLITLRNFADFHLIFAVVVFLVACGFIYHQDLATSLFYFSIMFSALVSVYMLNQGNIDKVLSIKQSSKLLFQAVPITILLFIVVPRLPPLWESAAQQSSSTGLSENLKPGDIANLAQSSELVFRAEFKDNAPRPEQRYFRAIVLDRFDGNEWSIGDKENLLFNTPDIELSGDATQYLIIAEPNDMKWQYSLDIPVLEEVISDRTIMRNQNYQLYTAKDNKKPSLYLVNSYLDAPLDHYMTESFRQKHLQVPSIGNPKTVDFVKNNIRSGMSEREILQALIEPFALDGFSYTLQPPLMLRDSVDQFLFTHRRGFCSHYASSLAYMLRLAEVPARVVTGYQGGELQNDKLLTIKQYDAHAWVEYWIENEGWTRIDPTAIVAPDRMMSGLLSSLNDEESELIDSGFSLNKFNNFPFVENMQELFVLLDHQWSQSVLRFDQDSQRDIITKLFGKFNAKTLMTFMLVAVGIIALFIVLVFLPYKTWFARPSSQPEAKLFALLGKYGWVKQRSETLQQFTKRIEPQLSTAQNNYLQRFVSLFYQYQYDQSACNNDKDANFEQVLINLKKTLKQKHSDAQT